VKCLKRNQVERGKDVAIASFSSRGELTKKTGLAKRNIRGKGSLTAVGKGEIRCVELGRRSLQKRSESKLKVKPMGAWPLSQIVRKVF